MKRSLKVLAVLCAALLAAASLAACGGQSASKADEASSKVTETKADEAPADFGDVKFKMPAGYEDTKESDYYTTIANSANKDQIMKISTGKLLSSETIEKFVEKKAAQSDRYKQEDSFEMGSFKWYPVRFTFNDVASSYFYAQAGDAYYVAVTAYTITEKDDDVKTVLGSLQVDESKI